MKSFALQLLEDRTNETDVTIDTYEHMHDLHASAKESMSLEQVALDHINRLNEAEEWLLTLESDDNANDTRMLALAHVWATNIDKQYGTGALSLESIDELTLEGVVSSIRKGLSNIKAGARDAVTAVKEYTAQMTGEKGRLKRVIEELIDTISDKDIAKGEFKVGGYGVRLHVDDKVDPATMVSTAASAADFTDAYFNDYLKDVMKLYTGFIKSVADDLSAKRLEAANEKMTDEKAVKGKDALVKKTSVLMETYDKDLPGGYNAHHEKETENDTPITIQLMTIRRTKGPETYTSGQTVPTATKTQLLSILKSAAKALVSSKEMDDIMDTLLAGALDKLKDSDLDDMTDKARKLKVKNKFPPKKLAAMIRNMNLYTRIAAVDVTDYGWRFSRAALKYCRASVNASSGVKEEAKD